METSVGWIAHVSVIINSAVAGDLHPRGNSQLNIGNWRTDT
jgi:hypothetical protein